MATYTNITAPNPQIPRGGPAYTHAAFTRPNNTTAYTAGDVVGATDPGGAALVGAILFPGAGRAGFITGAHILSSDIKTANYELLIFDEEPNNLADNAAYVPAAADLNTLVAIYKFADADKRSLLGAALWVPDDADGSTYQKHAYASADGNLYGTLITRSAYTPAAAAAARFNIRLSLDRGVA